jgi:hypothetical protein
MGDEQASGRRRFWKSRIATLRAHARGARLQAKGAARLTAAVLDVRVPIHVCWSATAVVEEIPNGSVELDGSFDVAEMTDARKDDEPGRGDGCPQSLGDRQRRP